MPRELCDCDAELLVRGDRALPDHVNIRECPECGMWAEYDVEEGVYHSTV